jgi:phosphoribosylformylglycinamidine cyclo-ligase
MSQESQKMTYKQAGVDIEKGEQFVDRIKKLVGRTLNKDVHSGIGGFASLYKRPNGMYLASGTDGVGTKLLVAHYLKIHHTIGIDLVAMCVNDILCTGAKPLFFLDYLACGHLDVDVHEKVVEGIVEGCVLSGAALVGGETAEMPDMYQDGHYDLGGFAVGEVHESQLLTQSQLVPGLKLVAVSSSGVHSNGLSLVRKLLKPEEKELWQLALKPTKIYVRDMLDLRETHPDAIKGLAHITGGGLSNITRLSSSLDAVITYLPSAETVCPLFKVLKERSGLELNELYQTFNMGIGMIVATDKPELVTAYFKDKGHQSWEIGHFAQGSQKLIYKL